MGILQKLRERFRKAERSATDEYWAMVHAEAAGEGDKASEADAVRILTRAGKTPEQFEADAELIRKRSEWSAIVRRHDELQAKMPGVMADRERLCAEHDRKIFALIDALQKSLAPGREIEADVTRLMGQAIDARRSLEQTAHPDVVADLNGAKAVVRRHREQVETLRERRARHRGNVSTLNAALSDSPSADQAKRYEKGIAWAKQQIAEIEQELAAAESARAKADASLDESLDRQLVA